MSKDHWYFAKTQIINSPSRKHGVSEEKEQIYLQHTANLIQEMGRKLELPLLCINTAVLFIQRFYVFHPITLFERFSMGASALFLAAKVEEHPRKLEHVCQVAKVLGIVKKGVKDAEYAQEIIINENVLLQTLGFEVLVQHPHQHVLRLCQMLKTSKTLSQNSYIMATHCLHLTRICLIYKPIHVACLCIYLSCQLINCDYPPNQEGRHWYTYGDPDMTKELLETMCDEFLKTFRECPENCKRKTLNATHENLLHKLSVHVSGLPIVKEPDQNAFKSDSPVETSTPSCEDMNPKHMPPSTTLDSKEPRLALTNPASSKPSHSNLANKQIAPSSASHSNSHSHSQTSSNNSAFTSSSNKTDRNCEVMKPKIYKDRPLSHSSSLPSSSANAAQFKQRFNESTRSSTNGSHSLVKTSTSCASDSKPVRSHSMKITIPKSRFVIPSHRSAVLPAEKTDQLPFSTQLYFGDHVESNATKKFKPN